MGAHEGFGCRKEFRRFAAGCPLGACPRRNLRERRRARLPALARREEYSTFSTNSTTRIIEGADHLSLLGNEQYAQQVSSAILDVMNAARTGEPLAQ